MDAAATSCNGAANNSGAGPRKYVRIGAASALILAYQGPCRRNAMGRAARAVAEREFSAARQVEAMVGHYGRLLQT